jgi:MFS family permease
MRCSLRTSLQTLRRGCRVPAGPWAPQSFVLKDRCGSASCQFVRGAWGAPARACIVAPRTLPKAGESRTQPGACAVTPEHPPGPPGPPRSPLARLPFYYGWVVVAVAFVTMGIGVNVRTAFSLLFPPILGEFGWDRAATAAVFSVGFLSSAAYSPFVGVAMDRFGPRRVIPVGALVVASGLVLTTFARTPWQMYLTLGMLVTGGTVIFSYIGHSMFVPNWFHRQRGLAIGVAFSGVGAGSIVLFPWVQRLIDGAGWRTACLVLAGLLVALVLPLNLLLQRTRPEDLGLLPDGASAAGGPAQRAAQHAAVVDPAWAGTAWTLRRALRTARFWWLALAYFCGLFAWYAVQVHQTKYLMEIGMDATRAAFALGLVGLTGIVGQIGLGHLSDRIGREWVWSAAIAGFALCYALLLVMRVYPAPALMYAMVASQGLLGYGAASVYGVIPAELFQGRAYGSIFGVVSLASSLGAAAGPWVAGAIQDRAGSYAPAFWLTLALCAVSIGAIWGAAPRKVRLVAGQVARRERAARARA